MTATPGVRPKPRRAPGDVHDKAFGGPGRALGVTLILAALAGVALRIWILASPLGAADSDESVAGLMARHMVHGHVSAFFWGQPYGGVQEPAAVAGLFALVGSNALAMKLVTVAFSGVAAVLVWRIGLRTVGERGAVIAAVIFWAGPAAFVWLSTKERGFYGTTIVLGLVVLLMVLRLAERASWRDAAILGLAGGSGWYASPQVVYLVLPSLAWLAIRSCRERGSTSQSCRGSPLSGRRSARRRGSSPTSTGVGPRSRCPPSRRRPTSTASNCSSGVGCPWPSD